VKWQDYVDGPKNPMESLKVGAEDFLSSEVPFEDGAQMTVIEIPQPDWRLEHGN
jgi:hypothetical protein